MSDALDQFFEEMLDELLGWRWDSAVSQAHVDATEKKWRDKWAEMRGSSVAQPDETARER